MKYNIWCRAPFLGHKLVSRCSDRSCVFRSNFVPLYQTFRRMSRCTADHTACHCKHSIQLDIDVICIIIQVTSTARSSMTYEGDISPRSKIWVSGLAFNMGSPFLSFSLFFASNTYIKSQKALTTKTRSLFHQRQSMTSGLLLPWSNTKLPTAPKISCRSPCQSTIPAPRLPDQVHVPRSL